VRLRLSAAPARRVAPLVVVTALWIAATERAAHA
jgi:hypothetical protein